MVTHEEFVNKYNGSPFYSVYPITGFIVFLSIFGIFGNSQIVWSTLRKSSLRSNCNIMIAFGAFSDVFHQTAHFILAYYIYTNKNFTNLIHCYWLQFLPVIWMNFGGFIVLSIGIDRFYSVLKPTRDVICVIAEAYHSKSKDIWSLSMLVVNSLIILVYSGVWLLIWSKSGQGRIDRRIIRSLTVVMILVLLGWFLTSVAMTVGVMKGLDEEQMFKIHLNAGWTVNFSIAMNYPVYMSFSKEYRQAFLEQLEILSCGLFKSKTIVSKITATTNNNDVSTTKATN